MKHKHNQNKPRTMPAIIVAGVVAFCAAAMVFAEEYPPRYQVTVGKPSLETAVPRKVREYRPIAPVRLNLDAADRPSILKVAMAPPAPNPPVSPTPSNNFNPYYSGSRIVPPSIPPFSLSEPEPASPDYPEFTSANTIVPPSVPEYIPSIPDYISEPAVVESNPEPKPSPVVKKPEPKKSSSRSSYSRTSYTRGRTGSSSSCRT